MVWSKNLSWRNALLIFVGLMALTGLIEYMMGRPPICTCGQVWLWSGNPASSNNSQHLLDPYSFSHVLHGFIFFYLGWLLTKKWPLSLPWRFVLATIIEATWEVWENSSWIIDRYRQTTVSITYYGDTIVNSLSDLILAMLAFWLASKLPWQFTLLAGVLIEVVLLYEIRDNLALNIIMLIYPLQAIKNWQASLST